MASSTSTFSPTATPSPVTTNPSSLRIIHELESTLSKVNSKLEAVALTHFRTHLLSSRAHEEAIKYTHQAQTSLDQLQYFFGTFSSSINNHHHHHENTDNNKAYSNRHSPPGTSTAFSSSSSSSTFGSYDGQHILMNNTIVDQQLLTAEALASQHSLIATAQLQPFSSSSSSSSSSTVSNTTNTYISNVSATDILEIPTIMEQCVRAAFTGLSSSSSSLSATGNTVASNNNNTTIAEEGLMDLLECVTQLYANHKLYRTVLGEIKPFSSSVSSSKSINPTTVSSVSSLPPHIYVLSSIIYRTRLIAKDMIDVLEVAINNKVSLPTILRAVSIYKRIRSLQTQARIKILNNIAVYYNLSSTLSANGKIIPSLLLDNNMNELYDTLAVRYTFLTSRMSTLWRDMDMLTRYGNTNNNSGSNSIGNTGSGISLSSSSFGTKSFNTNSNTSSLVRIADTHRTVLAETLNHYAALLASTVPTVTPSSSSSSITASSSSSIYSPDYLHCTDYLSRLLLGQCFSTLTQWLTVRLSQDIALIEDTITSSSTSASLGGTTTSGSAGGSSSTSIIPTTLGSLHQQLVYSARRCGRLGYNWELILLAPLLHNRTIEMIILLLGLVRKRFMIAMKELTLNSNTILSYSETGLRTHIHTIWTELINHTIMIINYHARSRWDALVQSSLLSAVQYHVDAVLTETMQCLSGGTVPMTNGSSTSGSTGNTLNNNTHSIQNNFIKLYSTEFLQHADTFIGTCLAIVDC